MKILEATIDQLTATDFEEIARIVTARKEGPISAAQVKYYLETDGGSPEFRQVVRYYLTLKRFNALVIDRMVTETTPLDLRHWQSTMSSVMIGNDLGHYVSELNTRQD